MRARFRAALQARKRQQGQALVFIAATTAIVLIVTLATFNVGQLSYHRMKLQNTADAVAYTAAVAQARQLNFTAYMNRGVIANQVQVAQVVSLTGWVRTLDDVHNGMWNSIATAFANMSPLSAMWTTPSNIIAQVAGQAKSFVDSAAPPVVKVLDKLIFGLDAASEAYHAGFLIDIATSLLPDVMEANEPEASYSTFGSIALPISMARAGLFTTRVDPSTSTRKDGDDRMAKVTQASNDYFYKGRISAANGQNPFLVPVWPIPFLFDPTRFVNPGFGPIFMMRFHSGGSSLKASGNDHVKAWSSLDASGLMAIMSLTLNILGIPVPIPIPLFLPAGAGAAAAGADSWMGGGKTLLPLPAQNIEHRNPLNSGKENWAAVQYGAAHINPMTAISAWLKTAEGPGENLDSSAGLRPYREVKDNVGQATSKNATTGTSNHNRNDVAPYWLIEIERGNGSLITSASGGYVIGGSSDGQLALPLATAGDRIRAMARSEAYFYRPKDLFSRPDGRTEWGSTYSPYWQARLSPSGLLEQGLSILGTWGEGELL